MSPIPDQIASALAQLATLRATFDALADATHGDESDSLSDAIGCLDDASSCVRSSIVAREEAEQLRADLRSGCASYDANGALSYSAAADHPLRSV